MKYVVFKTANGQVLEPVIFADHTTHSAVRIEGCTPVSAGFVDLVPGGVLNVHGKSDSLKLRPAKDDSRLLMGVLGNLGTSFFLQ